MKICCVSDLHGRLPVIPECDVLVIAGDVAPDAPNHWFISREDRRQYQWNWFQTTYAAWEQTVPAKHIVATPGNHDWCLSLPEECRTKWLISEGLTIEENTFWGEPYVPMLRGADRTSVV
jgi:hypothetical protein